MRRATRHRLALYLRFVLAGVVAGIVYGSLVGFAMHSQPFVGAAVGMINGGTMTAVLAGIEIFGTPTRIGQALERAPFLVTFAARWLVYSSVIMLIIGGELGARVLGAEGRPPQFAPLSLVFSFAVGFAILFVFQLTRLVGGRTLRDIVLGRYHRPRREERFFLFIDVAGSTPLAERVGPEAVHRFLGRVFRLAAGPIEEHGGDVYQYVGDEMVITWTLAEGRPAAPPIACFFAIEAALQAAATEFERHFGLAPRLRAALHAGPVITGEVGESRRAIVFHGDVMNTASRLEDAARVLERSFVASAEALARLDGLERYVLEDLGLQALRGRAEPVHVYAVTTNGLPGSDDESLLCA
ncbi:MAG: adenylate/guanylate cyclase domain-containing protein [Alphaproteobacteria bacterium]